MIGVIIMLKKYLNSNSTGASDRALSSNRGANLSIEHFRCKIKLQNYFYKFYIISTSKILLEANSFDKLLGTTIQFM